MPMPSEDLSLKPHLAQNDEIPPPAPVDSNRQSSSSSSSSDDLLPPHRRLPRGLTNDFRRQDPVNRKQEMQRNFRLISTIAFTSLVTGNWEVLLVANSLSLTNGGPAGLFWSVV